MEKAATNRFRPLPFLSNPHLQTIVGFLWKGEPFRHPSRHAIVQLSDGDRLVLHDSEPDSWTPGMPAALIIHGLGGSSQSGYVRRVASRLIRCGIRVFRIDLRGTGAGFALAERFYHGGRSDDIREALRTIHSGTPNSPLWLIGFSLGGNLALKLAGETGDTIPGLERVVAIAPPIDIPRCSELISQPHNRLYDRFFAGQLVRLARIRAQHFPNPPLPEFPKRITLRAFDDMFTAPRCGFADALDYYRKSSSFPVVPMITVPTLIVTARDDPFVDPEPFRRVRCPPNVRIEVHNHGGHLGFLGATGEGGARWVEKRILDWLFESAVSRSRLQSL